MISGTTERTEEFSYSENANLDITISDNASPPAAVSILTPLKKSMDQQIVIAVSSNKGTTENGSASSPIEESRYTEELYLDKVYMKAVAHKFYCPNCKSCIQKVIVLESDSTPFPDQNDDTWRCRSCFGFLILVGMILAYIFLCFK